ncbi:SMR family transporter [Prevotella falsenii]
MLNKSEQFTRLLPTLLSLAGYGLSFYALSFALREIPVGIAYAIWAGLGIVLITLVGVFFFKQTPDIPAIVGLLLIVAGVVVINLFSKMSVH